MKDICFLKDGNAVTLSNLTPDLCRLLEEELSYNRIRHLRGREAKEARSNIEVIPTDCYRYIRDPDGELPTRLMTSDGFLPHLAKVLRDRNYRVRVKDLRPHPRPEVFKPRWSALSKEKFRWKQRDILEKIVKNPFGRIECPTGYGKSYLIAMLCCLWPKARIDITTHSAEVIEQLYYDLSDRLPSVGLIHSKKKVRDRRVMCYSGKSLHRSDADADVLIVDELHEFGTDDYLSRVARYRFSRRYGFSANTNDRMDGADFELMGAFGPVLVQIPYQDAVENGCIVPIKVRWLDVVMDSNPVDGLRDVPKKRWGLWRNGVRNKIIANAAREYPDDEQVLIIVDTLEHAVFLKRELPEFTMCYSEQAMTADRRRQYVDWELIDNDEPEMTADRRYRLKKAFSAGELKKVIATGVWNRGVDFRGLSVLIRADAKSSAIADTQIPGRVSRVTRQGDKPFGTVIDLLDQFDLGFKRKAQERKRRYESKGWSQLLPDRNIPFLKQQFS